MAKKNKKQQITITEELDLETEVSELVEETTAPVAEIIPAPVKVPVLPILPVTEVARQFKQYKKYHDAVILSFCKSTGLPIEGTEPEMKAVLARFGW